MKRFLFAAAILLAAIFSAGVEHASAASLSQAQLLALSADADGGVIVAQYGGGGGGGSSDGGYRRRYDDDGGYRERRYNRDDGYRDYCRRCAWRCRDGWCPPRCWGWHRQCRRDRYDD
jgi:hypothetical protein